MENIFMKEGVDKLYKYIKHDGKNFIIFSKYDCPSNVLSICLCDGYNIHAVDLDENNLEEYTNNADCCSKESFLSLIKLNTSSGNITVSPNMADTLIVRFGEGMSSFTLPFKLATDAQQKQLFRHVFFEMAEKIESSSSSGSGVYISCHNPVESAISTSIDTSSNDVNVKVGDGVVGGTAPVLLDFQPTGMNKQKLIKNRPKFGTSLVNPGARKRKKATGIVFDDDS